VYALDAVREDARWVMRHVHIDNVWFTGDPWIIASK
jgi:hypothetical protein